MKNSKMKIYYFKKLASTNEKAKNFDENSVIISEIQTKGKGRFKRKWSSGKGGLWMSIVLKPEIKDPKKITFMTSISIQKSIKKSFGLNTKIKWPNDILFNGKKLCGILTEAFFKNGHIDRMIVGIGLNVNNKLPLGLRNKAISLNETINKEINIKKLADKLLKEFSLNYKKYKNNNKKLLTNWKSLSDTIGRNVEVKTIDGLYSGEAIDVDKDCNLILRLRNGKLKKIVEGDISYF